MSDYEPFEAAQGDPWSTEPVGDSARQRREPDSDTYQDDSQVLARVPHVGDEPGTDHYRDYGHSRSSHRGRRSHSQRPGIPAPVWVVVGMGLVAIIAAPFLLSNNSGDETALDTPSWEVEMPAPDADLAPAWSSESADSQWQQPGTWAPEGTTVTAEPAPAPTWNTNGDWVGAPSNAPYAYNADPNSATPNQPTVSGFGPDMPGASTVPSAAGTAPGVAWGTNVSPTTPSSPTGTNYQALSAAPQSGYPAANAPNSSWSQPTAPTSEHSTAQPMSNPIPWNSTPPTPSLATPQPENVMPGYGNLPTVQPNPYVESPRRSTLPQGPYAGNTPAASQQYSDYTPQYPVAGQPTADPYPVTNYPQTAMTQNPARPISSVPTGGTAYPSPSLSSPTPYPPATGSTYPQAAPSLPMSQPGYGAGASSDPSQQQRSVARLNGTIQEPEVRNAYDDRSRPSYY